MSVTVDETIVGVSIRRADLGAVGDGVTDDAGAFANLAASATIDPDELLILPKGIYRIGSDQTITHPVYFHRGAVLKPDAGVTVTLARSFEAGIARIFDGSGTVAIPAGSAATVYPQWWGATGEGVSDDAPAFRAACDTLDAAGGGHLFVPPGTYLFDSGLPGVTATLAGCIIGSNVRIEGAGPASVIQAGPGLDATGSNSNFLLEARGDLTASHAAAARDCTISNLRLVGRGVTFPYPSGIHGAPYSEGLRVLDCEFESLGMFGCTDHSSSWNGLVSGCVSRGCASAHQVTGTTITHTVIVTNNRTVNCWNTVTVQFGAACTVADNAIIFDAGYAAAPASNMITSAILVQGQKGCVVTGNTIDARKVNAAGGIVVPVGIHVGGNYPGAGDALLGYARSCLISDNVILGPVTTGVLLAGAQDCLVMGNRLGDPATGTRPTFGVTLTDNSATGQKSLRNTVCDNSIYVYTSAGAGIQEVQGKTGDNEIRHNDIASAPATAAVVVNTAAPVSRVYQNRGYVTEASGEATVAAAATSVTVNPGISEVLVRRYIRLTPLNSMNAATKFRVVNVTATTFDIAVDVAPGGTGATFSWAYQKC